jgi:hypothetical protein
MPDIIQVGLGPIGQQMVEYALQRPSLNIVGAVDVDPQKIGRDVGEFCGLAPLGILISATLDEAIRKRKPHVALVTTVSSLKAFEPQAVEIARAGIHIVSTCEELFFPWNTQPEIARRIDAVCTENNVVCLGAGVNPGYLMDFLPTVLSGLCQHVKSVNVWRVQDAAVRRIPFQRKIGAGLPLDEFEAKRKAGTLRHVGLPESIDFIAHRLGWKLDRRIEILEPIIAEKGITAGYKPIAKGMVCGVRQVGCGFVGEDEVIRLTFVAAIGQPDPYEQIEIDGVPTVHCRISGGINGDAATCGIALNCIGSVLRSAPGLKTMADIPPVAFLP